MSFASWNDLHLTETLEQVNNFPKFSLAAASVPDFVDSWRSYAPSDDIYASNINHGGAVTTDNVVALMKWKAGPRFQAKAEEWARAVPVHVFNDTRPEPTLSDEDLDSQYKLILQHLRGNGLSKSDRLIWPVFLCHVAQPQTTPIYDVNVWRAWGHIDGWITPERYRQRPTMFRTYLEYRCWFNGLTSTYGLEPRHLDQALGWYGRFLTSGWGRPFR